MRRAAFVVALLGCAYPEFAFAPPIDATTVATDTLVVAETSADDTSVVDTEAPEVSETDTTENDTSAATDTSVADTAAPDTAPVDTAPVFVTLLARGGSWRYLDGGRVPSSTNWRGGGGYDDSGWKNGLAQLGFGDGDEKTVIDGSFTDAAVDSDALIVTPYPAAYFRRFITVTGAADFDELTFRVLRDDGAVVYVNGVEALRTNMPSGTITPTTFASTTVSGAAEDTFHTFAVPATALKEGSNVLAVEVHQANSTSSDMGFDLELVGRKP